MLETKFAVPRPPPAAIARPRLLEMLDQGARHPLTLVAAPAGAGKTALVAAWVDAGRAPGPVAWLSLDDSDAEPRRFWQGVLATLGRAGARLGQLEVHPADRPGDALPALVDALAGREDPIVLVLDDFHEVSGTLHGDVERLLRFPSATLRLVVISRADPQVSLGRMRLQGQLTEIRAGDLAFTRAEAGALLRATGVRLSEGGLARLWRRTEGWAAAVRLAALSLVRHADPEDFVERFAGTDATVSDYLVSEVLAAQPPELRDFLLRTSIVDLLCAELVDALTGRDDGQRVLHRLERSGALIDRLDESGTWYRYHPLFAELLRAELRAEHHGALEDLHRRAADWLAAHDDVGRAVRHAAEAEAWDLVARLIADRWVHLAVSGELGQLRGALTGLPPELIAADPELALAVAGMLLVDGDDVAAAPCLRRAEAGETLVPEPRRARFGVTMAATRLYEGRLTGDPAEAVAAARELLGRHSVFDGDVIAAELRGLTLMNLGIAELWTGEIDAAVRHLERAHAAGLDARRDWLVLGSSAHLAIALAFRGELGRAGRRAEEAVAIAERCGWSRTSAAGAAFSVLGGLSFQRQQLEETERMLARAGAALTATRDRPLRALHALNAALLLADKGDPEAALDVLQAGRDELGDWPLLAPLRDMFTAQEGLLRAAVGDHDAALALLEGAEGGGARTPVVPIALARLHLHDGDPEAARALLAPELAAPQNGFVALQAEAWMLDALALDALADHEGAARSLERALDLAEPAGLRRMLVMHGLVARPLLNRQRRHGTAHPALVGEVLATIEHHDATGRHAALLLADPLSEREQAILRYLPTMMSNQEIAGELFVSVNTVKTHLKAIYRKLDAPGRREAVRRARDAGLLPR